jgi:hypothetical protein
MMLERRLSMLERGISTAVCCHSIVVKSKFQDVVGKSLAVDCDSLDVVARSGPLRHSTMLERCDMRRAIGKSDVVS